MKRRIVCLIVAVSMLLSMGVISATAEEDTRYEGIAYFQSGEDMLKSLNDDAAAELWDSNSAVTQAEDPRNNRDEQLTALQNASDAFFEEFAELTAPALTQKWASYCARILTRDSDGIGSRDGNVINYFKMLDIFKKEDASLSAAELAVKAQFSAKHLDAEYDVTNLSLSDSFAKLDDYTYQMGVIISDNRSTLDSYNLTEEKKTEYMLHGTKALYQIFFHDSAENMRTAFDNDFLGDDEGKKLIAVMYGKSLTNELAHDNISDVLISYVNDNFLEVKNELGELIKKEYGENTAVALFDFIKKTVVNAYDAYPSVTAEHKADMRMLFGDPALEGDKGALQIMFENLDTSAEGVYAMINTWFNLFLRQHTQLEVAAEDAVTIENGVDVETSRKNISNGASAFFVIKNLSRYGVEIQNDEWLSLGSDWLDVACYNEDGSFNNFVSYYDGSFFVSRDSSKDAEYNAYLQLTRLDGAYIETYPIKVLQPSISTGGGSSSVKHTVTYISDGVKISIESVKKGEKITLKKPAAREGYVFEGWYLDEALTNYVEEITLTDNITLYAKWVPDNGTAGSGTHVPELLNGNDHFAYVIGYPDGMVRPEGNISRAEVATIFFRLLNPETRDSNLTYENAFVDVTAEDWHNAAISTLAKLGILEGRTETEFVPNAPITRAEFAAICARFDDCEYSPADSFTDIAEHWAIEYIEEAAGRGWIRGYEDNSFRPNRFITRAEAMTLINRVLNRVPETSDDLYEGMNVWIDNTEDMWYYLPVQEATNSHDYEMKNHIYEKWTGLNDEIDWTQYQ